MTLAGQRLTPLGLSFLICAGRRAVHVGLRFPGPPRSPLGTAPGPFPCTQRALGLPCSQGVSHVSLAPVRCLGLSEGVWAGGWGVLPEAWPWQAAQQPGRRGPTLALWQLFRDRSHGHSLAPTPQPQAAQQPLTPRQAPGRACDTPAHSQGWPVSNPSPTPSSGVISGFPRVL